MPRETYTGILKIGISGYEVHTDKGKISVRRSLSELIPDNFDGKKVEYRDSLSQSETSIDLSLKITLK